MTYQMDSYGIQGFDQINQIIYIVEIWDIPTGELHHKKLFEERNNAEAYAKSFDKPPFAPMVDEIVVY